MTNLEQYKNLIRTAKLLQHERILLKKNDKKYYEKHHILPICICKYRKIPQEKYNSPNNILLLTAREHFRAHKFLALWALEKYGESHCITKKLVYAWNAMKWGKSNKRKEITEEEYETSRELYSKIHSKNLTGKPSPKKGIPLSEEHKNKMRDSRMKFLENGGRTGFSGKTHSEESKRKISENSFMKNNPDIENLPNNIKMRGLFTITELKSDGTKNQFNVHGLRKWCRDNNHDVISMRRLMKGTKTRYKNFISIKRIEKF